MTKLTFGTLPHTHWQPLTPILQLLGWAPERHLNPDQWLSHANTGQSNPAIIAYSHPNTQLADALRAGTTPSQALNQWLDQASTLLGHFRQHRQTTLLVNLEQALANPNALLEYAQQRFDFSANRDQPLATDIKPEQTDPDAADLIAFYLIRTSSVAQELLDRLEASTTPLADESLAQRTPGLNIDELYVQLQKASQAVEAKDELQGQQGTLARQKAELAEENQLIIEQLHKVQEELERQYLQKEALTAQYNKAEASLKESNAALSASQAELEQANASRGKVKAELNQANSQLAEQQGKQKAELATATAKNADLEDENRLILDQLFKVQEELEQQYLKNQEFNGIQKHARQLQQQLDKANTRLERLTHSLSWRATAPARALGKPFRKPSPEARWVKNQINIIRQAEALDTEWYTRTYPDVVENGTDPIEHFVRFGAEENRNPSPQFNTAWYKANYPDVLTSKLNPLVHYIRFGQAEGRQPKP